MTAADCSAAVRHLDTDLLGKNLLNTIMSPSAYALVSACVRISKLHFLTIPTGGS